MDGKIESTVENVGEVCPICGKAVAQGDLRTRDNISDLVEQSVNYPEQFNKFFGWLLPAKEPATPPQFKTKREKVLYELMHCKRDTDPENYMAEVEYNRNFIPDVGRFEADVYYVNQHRFDSIISFRFLPRNFDKDDVLEFLDKTREHIKNDYHQIKAESAAKLKALDKAVCPRCGRDDGLHEYACKLESLTDDQVKAVVEAYKPLSTNDDIPF